MMINYCGIWVALKEGCKVVDVNGGGRGQFGEVLRSVLGRNYQSLKGSVLSVAGEFRVLFPRVSC